jgi:hypothetical protein
MKRGLRILAYVVGGFMLLCLAAAGLAALSNRGLNLEPSPPDPQGNIALGPLDKARLVEALQLKRALGETVWPGWGETEMPVLVWNRAYSFLIGHSTPPAEWLPVTNDRFQEQVYFYRATDDPQNFAVQVGDRWVASIATKAEVDARLIEMIRDALPAPLQAIVPYRAIIQPTEVQISAVLHESFHVYQAEVAPERLEAAEAAHGHGDQYWAADEAMHEAWETEIDLLAQALRTQSDSEARVLVTQFLEQRARRRQEASLDAALVDYERQIEWEEGLAKYVELAAWRAAYQSADYRPVSEMGSDRDFKSYRSFKRRWSQELGQMKRQAAREGETRFYYTGMAQATLLDRLLPGWKEQVLAEGVWLETLLAAATE